MRPVEAVEWAKAFDVEVKDLPATLGSQVRRLNGIRDDLAKAYTDLVESPDHAIGEGVWRSLSALNASQSLLMYVAADARRSA